MANETIHDLTAAYALDALDADEARGYEAHLSACARCREELATLQEAASGLAYAAEAPAPPAGLRDRILEQARSEPGVVVPLRRRPAVPYALGAVAAAAASVAIGLGIWGASLADRLDRERAVSAVLADPDARSLPLKGAKGRLVVTEDGRAALVAALPSAPAGRTYEIWVIRQGDPLPAGLFEIGGDAVALTRPVPGGATVAVTVEPDGGVDAPTSRPLLTVET